MGSVELAYCGLDCGKCPSRAEAGCPGCQAAAGKMYWGECQVATCCIGKGVAHCGESRVSVVAGNEKIVREEQLMRRLRIVF